MNDTKNTDTLLRRLLDAGYPKEEVYHHGSDLYVYVTPLTNRVISQWCADNGHDPDWMCPTFKDQITGRKMFDCAFQFYEDVQGICNTKQ